MKIVVLDGFTLNPGDLSWEGLEQLGSCEIYKRTKPKKLLERAQEADILLTNKVVLSKETIAQLPKLKYIGVLATGYNVVDTAAAKNAGIVVTSIPAYSTESVAQLVFSFILHYTQNVGSHADSVANGDWAKSKDFCYVLSPQREIAGKTLGIIGFGRIGQAVARIAEGFQMKVIYQNRSKKQVEGLKASQVELDELLAQSDFISVNCPLTEANKGFINKETISKMKSSAFLINTGRGPLINEEDLADALDKGLIAGAGLDVLSQEPPSKNNPLVGVRNCFITPHIAWSTIEARQRLLEMAIGNVKAFQEGNPTNVVWDNE
ncbi:D-2-hydroxyacid dehydrogenase [Flammeovirgaceae bacterium SG7u.111]|nr:D-2-hydroxyacid dehydrogenase [Flammeovirgaceae bacterium SG7u.132]WPO38643.1 D-2-hydroxyacid dehydrogenase [Flammeovirgaceae bacterium SG7u.111]